MKLAQPQIPSAEKFRSRSVWEKEKRKGGLGGIPLFSCQIKMRPVPWPAWISFQAGHHRKTLFSLGEKEIRRAQNEKSKEYFSVVWRACRAVAGLASLVGGLLKEISNISQKTPPICTFRLWITKLPFTAFTLPTQNNPISNEVENSHSKKDKVCPFTKRDYLSA